MTPNLRTQKGKLCIVCVLCVLCVLCVSVCVKWREEIWVFELPKWYPITRTPHDTRYTYTNHVIYVQHVILVGPKGSWRLEFFTCRDRDEERTKQTKTRWHVLFVSSAPLVSLKSRCPSRCPLFFAIKLQIIAKIFTCARGLWLSSAGNRNGMERIKSGGDGKHMLIDSRWLRFLRVFVWGWSMIHPIQGRKH